MAAHDLDTPPKAGNLKVIGNQADDLLFFTLSKKVQESAANCTHW